MSGIVERLYKSWKVTTTVRSTKSLSNRSFTRIARVSNSFENMASLTGSYSRRICVRLSA
jgi:hypothetical protein